MVKQKRWNKWVVWLLGGLTATVVFALSLVLMVHGDQSRLQGYARSIGNLPEVAQVLAVSQFMGTEPVLVSRVVLLNGEEHLYFIQGDTVVLQLPASEIVPAAALMEDLFGTTDIVRYGLGLYGERAIYELVANTQSGVNYIWVDALTGEILLSFVLD